MTTYLGYFAAAITVGAFVPQAVRILRTRRTRDLSPGTFALLITSGSLWIIYGIANRDWPIVVTNLGMVTLNGVILGAKIRYERAAPANRPAGP